MTFLKDIWNKHKERVKKNKEFLLDRNRKLSLKNLVSLQSKINKDIKSSIDNCSSIAAIVDNQKEIENISVKVKDYKALSTKIMLSMRYLFSDKKKKFTVIIILKSSKIKAFDVYENVNTQGFLFNNGYYNIARDCVVNQNYQSLLFYFEGLAAPIRFSSLIPIRDDFGVSADGYEVELSCENLVNVMNGKAFKGIITLGKDTGFNIDWKMALAGLAVVVLGILHATGQIDLVSMLSIG